MRNGTVGNSTVWYQLNQYQIGKSLGSHGLWVFCILRILLELLFLNAFRQFQVKCYHDLQVIDKKQQIYDFFEIFKFCISIYLIIFQCLVRYIDYGNTEILNRSDIVEIPLDLQFSSVAKKYRLWGLQIPSSQEVTQFDQASHRFKIFLLMERKLCARKKKKCLFKIH